MKTHRLSKRPQPLPDVRTLRNVDIEERINFQFYYDFVCCHAKKGCRCPSGRIGVYADGVGGPVSSQHVPHRNNTHLSIVSYRAAPRRTIAFASSRAASDRTAPL